MQKNQPSPGDAGTRDVDKAGFSTARGLSAIGRESWDRLATPEKTAGNPFLAYEFLHALEETGCVGAGTGWQPCHLVMTRHGRTVGVMPLYAKSHSQGEYIFDHAFAHAYEQAGGRYYPKLLGAIPFTPVPGPRLLVADEALRLPLARGALAVARQTGVSSLGVNFLEAPDLEALKGAGFVRRTTQQFHFHNKGYTDFSRFLETLSSRKRKNLRKERTVIEQENIEIDWITGRDITEAHLDAFWVFYQDTGARKWGMPYLTRAFLSQIAQTMPAQLLLIMARRRGRTAAGGRTGRYIAGALNMIGAQALYGRYWGCIEHVPFLHFELCYYQAIDYALAHGLARVEAGAQGGHKLARGYEPTEIYSAHWFSDPGFHEAVGDYLRREGDAMKEEMTYLKGFTPFKGSG